MQFTFAPPSTLWGWLTLFAQVFMASKKQPKPKPPKKPISAADAQAQWEKAQEEKEES